MDIELSGYREVLRERYKSAYAINDKAQRTDHWTSLFNNSVIT